jgi:hypothetical protein
MEKPRKPEQVQDAQISQDREALAAMGRKGGINAAIMNADRKAQKEKDLNTFLENQAKIYRVNEEGDVLPPDPGTLH